MTAIAQVPCAVTSEVLSGTVTAGGPGLVDRRGLRPAAGQPGRRSTPGRGRPARASAADHERASAWRAYWLSSTENEDLVLVVPGPGSAATSWRM